MKPEFYNETEATCDAIQDIWDGVEPKRACECPPCGPCYCAELHTPLTESEMSISDYHNELCNDRGCSCRGEL